MTTTWLDYLALAAATALVVAAVAVDRARAEDHFWADRAFREDHTRVRNTPRYRPAHPHRRIVREPARVYGYVHTPEPKIRVQRDELSDVTCFPMLEGLSGEHHSEDAAYTDAVRDWRARTRFKYGERFALLDHANGLERQCVQSSVNQTITGRVAEAVGGSAGQLHRCEIRARPCMAPTAFGSQK